MRKNPQENPRKRLYQAFLNHSFSVQLLVREISWLKKLQHNTSSSSKDCKCIQLLYSLSWKHGLLCLVSSQPDGSLVSCRCKFLSHVVQRTQSLSMHDFSQVAPSHAGMAMVAAAAQVHLLPTAGC